LEATNRIGRMIAHVTRARLETESHAIGQAAPAN